MVNVLIVAGLVALIITFIGLGIGLLTIVLGALAHIFDLEWLFLSYWESAVVYLSLWVIGGFFKNTNNK